MVNTVDYSMEDFIANSEKILVDMVYIDGLADSEEGTDTADKIRDAAAMASLTALKESMNLQFADFIGFVEIRISEDEMSALADFYPPDESMNPIEQDVIVEQLSVKGITEGVDWDVITEALFRCNTERIRINDVVVARGTKPIDEVPEHLLMDEHLINRSSSPKADSAQIDFRELSPFVLVKEGEELAGYIPKREGRMV